LLQRAYHEEAARTRAARLDQKEREKYLSAIAELRREKAALAEALERTSEMAGALGLARPAAIAPFVA